MIDLLNIEPNKVPIDPKNYSFMLYGGVKKGKTTFVYELYKDRVLFIGTEQRHDAIAGIHVQHITSWAEYLQVLAQLRQPQLQEKYDVICIDTVTNLYDFLETFIKGKHKVQNIGDVPYGGGWTDLKDEWSKGIKSIENFGYNPVFIFHSKDEVKLIPITDIGEKESDELKQNIGEGVTLIKDKQGKQFFEVNRVTYDAPVRVVSPVNKMVDNIMYIDEVVGSSGELERVLRMRGSMFYDAGSTFEGIADTIPLDPDEYKNAIKEAVERNDPEDIATEDIQKRRESKIEYNYDELMNEAKELGVKIFEAKKQKELQEIVENNFGTGNKLTDATPSQAENLAIAIEEMKELLDI